jgi:V-type H+-transporting ATPase subunit D
MTNRRVNALEFVLIPRITEIIDYIKDELDEIDREDFVRLKKTQDNKKKKKIEQAADALKRKGQNVDDDVTDGTPKEEEQEEVIPSQFIEESDGEDDIFV